MASFAVILAAAGKSSRFGKSNRKKPFLELKGRPIWVRALEPFIARDDVQQVLISIAPDDLDWFKDQFRANLAFMNVELVAGGAERADSVQNALSRVRNDIDFVAVHDAARPLLTKADVNKVFSAAEKHGAAIPACPVVSTLKRVQGGNIVETVPRADLWQAQTPQTFRRELLLRAYAQRKGFQATDEAQLVERLGEPVHIVECPAMNLKITTQEDFRMAEVLLDAIPRKDGLRPLHPFADERPGVDWS